jgi:ComF family protein
LGVNLVEELLNILMPARCVWCRDLGSVICQACASKLKLTPRPISRLELHGFAIHEYSNSIATLIHEYKENQQFSLAKNIAEAMLPAIGNFDLDNAALVPMPSKKSSFAKRGFNPAELLARQIVKLAAHEFKVRIPVSRCLKINRAVGDQAALSGESRRTNLIGSMKNQGFPTGFSAVLIDDVITTGSTLREASRCLTEAGVKVQGFLTFAETPPQNIRKRHEKVL